LSQIHWPVGSRSLNQDWLRNNFELKSWTSITMSSLQVELDKHKEEGGGYQSHDYLQIELAQKNKTDTPIPKPSLRLATSVLYTCTTIRPILGYRRGGF